LRPGKRRGTIPGMEAAFETGRLVLRRFTVGDADELAALDGDPEVMRFLGPVKSRTEIAAVVLVPLMPPSATGCAAAPGGRATRPREPGH
jgi:RimJ/RimL family protein N-acetyltransferase